MTFKILTDDTLKVIHCSDICTAADRASKNKHVDPLNIDANVPQIIKSAIEQGVHNSFSPSPNHGEEIADGSVEPSPADTHGEKVQVETVKDEETSTKPKPLPQMHIVDPQDLVRCTFLLDEQEDDGQRFRAKIVEFVTHHDEKNKMDPEHVCFRCTVNDNQYEDIIKYNELMDYIQNNTENDETLWHFKCISGHQGPLWLGDPHYAGAKYNVQVKWETGEVTYEPLDVIAADDPITCAVYMKDNELLDDHTSRS